MAHGTFSNMKADLYTLFRFRKAIQVAYREGYMDGLGCEESFHHAYDTRQSFEEAYYVAKAELS